MASRKHPDHPGKAQTPTTGRDPPKKAGAPRSGTADKRVAKADGTDRRPKSGGPVTR